MPNEELKLSQIRTDGGTQPRAGLDSEHVGRIVEARQAGELIPPPVVFYDGSDYWLADGFHRYESARLARVDRIFCQVRSGTRRDAVLHAVGANRTHGLPRSRADVRRSIEQMLTDEEWGQWSDREIARRVGCHNETVGAVRKELIAGDGIRHLKESTRQAPDGKQYPAQRSPAAPAERLQAAPPQNAEISAPKCYDCGTTEAALAGDGIVRLCQGCRENRGIAQTESLSFVAIDQGFAYRKNGGTYKIERDGAFVRWINNDASLDRDAYHAAVIAQIELLAAHEEPEAVLPASTVQALAAVGWRPTGATREAIGEQVYELAGPPQPGASEPQRLWKTALGALATAEGLEARQPDEEPPRQAAPAHAPVMPAGGALYAEVEHWIADLLEKLTSTDRLLLNLLLGDWDEGNIWDDLTSAALVKEATAAHTLTRLLAERQAEAVAA